MLYPGASLPFGMVKLSPDNQDEIADPRYNNEGWKAGYEYTIESIAGFSHLHSWTMAGLLTMPTMGALNVTPGSASGAITSMVQTRFGTRFGISTSSGR